MPSAEASGRVMRALQQIRQLPHSQELRDRLAVACRFYITYSSTKPALKDADTMLEMLDSHASASISMGQVARNYGVGNNSIYNAWDILHTVMTYSLTPEELCCIGLAPAQLLPRALRIADIYNCYTPLYDNLTSDEGVAGILDANPHFEHFAYMLSQGHGMWGFLEDYVGPNSDMYFQDHSLHFVEDLFRRGFAEGVPALAGEVTERGRYNHRFLRRAVFARFLNRRISAGNPGREVDGAEILACLERIADIPAQEMDHQTYISYLQSLLPKLPYYESKMAKGKVYPGLVSRMDIARYSQMYNRHDLVPLPLWLMLDAIATGKELPSIIADFKSLGIVFAESTLRNELTSVGRLMEAILLTPDLMRSGDDRFYEVITSAHKQDIAILTAAAGGHLQVLES